MWIPLTDGQNTLNIYRLSFRDLKESYFNQNNGNNMYFSIITYILPANFKNSYERSQLYYERENLALPITIDQSIEVEYIKTVTETITDVHEVNTLFLSYPLESEVVPITNASPQIGKILEIQGIYTANGHENKQTIP